MYNLLFDSVGFSLSPCLPLPRTALSRPCQLHPAPHRASAVSLLFPLCALQPFARPLKGLPGLSLTERLPRGPHALPPANHIVKSHSQQPLQIQGNSQILDRLAPLVEKFRSQLARCPAAPPALGHRDSQICQVRFTAILPLIIVLAISNVTTAKYRRSFLIKRVKLRCVFLSC